ncbi:MAG: hypothetical protein H6907_22000 [Hyphomicrobiales bacterium]|nr:hypothetical protein [Hyphomicrobiales bacterium]MCP5374419.1 hypothetical protein [Hyphomicrobiales bacterium]
MGALRRGLPLHAVLIAFAVWLLADGVPGSPADPWCVAVDEAGADGDEPAPDGLLPVPLARNPRAAAGRLAHAGPEPAHRAGCPARRPLATGPPHRTA